MAMKVLLYLLMLGSLAVGHVLPEQSNGPMIDGHIFPKRAMMLYKSGEYILANMDLTQVTLMRSLLGNLWSALLPVIQDAKATNSDGSPNPSTAYTTFFKDSTNMPYVASLLTNVTTGAAVGLPSSLPPGAAPYTPNGSPVFFAISGLDQFLANIGGVITDMFDFCQTSNNTAAYPASSTGPIPFIIICPLFWTAQPPTINGDLPPGPVNGQPASNCLSVNTAINRYRYNGPRTDGLPLGFGLTQYRMWILLEELAHLYTHVSLGVTIDNYDINKCFRLSSQRSLQNGPTYSYYAASIFANCKDFPYDNRRKNELLEVDQDPDDPTDDGPDTPSVFEGAVNVTDTQVLTNDTIVFSSS